MSAQPEIDVPKSDRKIAQEEVDHDLNEKSLEQLLVDVHHETLLHDPNRTILDNFAHANKRIASIMVRVAQSNEKTGNLLLIITVALFVLTGWLILCGCLQIAVSIVAIVKSLH